MLTDPAVVQVTQVIAHVVVQEVDLIQLQKVGRKRLHCHLKHLLSVKQIESQVIIVRFNSLNNNNLNLVGNVS